MLPSLHYIPTNMTYCNTTRASDLAEDEQLRAFQGYLKKLPKHGAFSMVCLPVECACAGVFHFGRYRSTRQYVSVFSSSHCDCNASLLILFLTLSICSASGLNGIAANWDKNKPSNWNGNNPCGDKWTGIICIGNRVTSMLVSASKEPKIRNFVSSLYPV